MFRLFACGLLLMLTLCRAQAQGSISGTITLQGVSPDQYLDPQQPIYFDFVPSSGGNALIRTWSLDYSGDSYSFTGLQAGTYTVGVKGPKWLRKEYSNVVISSTASATVNVTLLGGDANNDNRVESQDFGIWASSVGGDAAIPGSGYDPQADFNCDGLVDMLDFDYLNSNNHTNGVFNQINLSAAASPTTGNNTLTWNFQNATGQTIATPANATIKIYRSSQATGGFGYYATAASGSASYTDPNSSTGYYYYQLIAFITNSTTGATTYGISNVTSVASNPLIENLGNGNYRITGFQADRQTVNYQAFITNGLLSNYMVNGRDLFHSQNNDGITLPLQFDNAAIHDYHTLAGGGQRNHNLDSINTTDYQTLSCSFSDQTDQTTLTYKATPNNLQMTLSANYGVSFCLPLGCAAQEAVTSVQNLAVPGYGAARLPGSGLTYALPLLPSSQDSHDNSDPLTVSPSHIRPIRAMRFFLGDSVSTVDSAVDFTYILNDAAHPGGDGDIFPHINSAAGSQPTTDYSCWGRNFGSGYVQFLLTPATATVNIPTTPTLPQTINNTPSFHLLQDGFIASTVKSYNGLGMFASSASVPGNTFSCRLEIAPNVVVPSAGYQFAYYFTDYWGSQPDPTIHYKTLLPADFTVGTALYGSTALFKFAAISFPLPTDNASHALTGYFRLVGSLTPAGTAAGSTLLPNQDYTDFGVYNALPQATPYLYDISNLPPGSPNIQNPVAGSNLGQSDPAIPRILGVRSLRIENKAVTNGLSAGQTTTPSFTRASEADPNPEVALGLPRHYQPKTYGILATLPLASNPLLPDYNTGFSNPFGVDDQNNMVLFGSIAPKTVDNKPYTSKDFLNDTLDMVSSLTIYDRDANGNIIMDIQPNGAMTARGANPIKYWSLYNEPDAEHGIFTEDQIKYTYLPYLADGQEGVLAAYFETTPHSPSNTPTIHTSTPHNRPVIIGPNLNRIEAAAYYNDSNGVTHFGGPLSWMLIFFQDGGGFYIGVVGVHTYTGNDRSWEEHGVAESLADLRYMMDQTIIGPNGTPVPKYPDAAGKPLWITEHGWDWNWSADMPRLQAEYIVRRYALAAQAGIPHEHNEYYYSPAIGNDHNFELWNGDNSFADSQHYYGAPLRSGMAMRMLNEKTAGMAYDKMLGSTLQTGKYVHAVPYTDYTNETIIVWGDDFTDSQMLPDGHQIYPVIPTNQQHIPVRLPLTSSDSSLIIEDIMGNRIDVDQKDNGNQTYTYQIPATGSPVYVIGSHNDSFLIGSGFWPALTSETNYALGGTASAPSVTSGLALFQDPHLNFTFNYLSGGTAALNDGSWQYDEICGLAGDPALTNALIQDYESNQTINHTARLKSAWIGTTDYALTNQNGFVGDAATVTFPAKKIDTIVAVAPSSNNSGGGLPGVRDYDLQIITDYKDITNPANWQTMKSVRGNTSEWVLYANFPMVPNVTGVRIQILKVNNGRWFDDYTAYPLNSAPNSLGYGGLLRASLYELEAYGPTVQ